MQADILQVPVRRPAHLETTSLGAALAAGIGAGLWTEEEAFTDLKHTTGTCWEREAARQACTQPSAAARPPSRPGTCAWKIVVWFHAPAPPARCSPAGGTLFEPRITKAAASRRHAKWQKAVQRSFALADLTRDLEEDSEERGAAEGSGGGGLKAAAAEPAGPLQA